MSAEGRALAVAIGHELGFVDNDLGEAVARHLAGTCGCEPMHEVAPTGLDAERLQQAIRLAPIDVTTRARVLPYVEVIVAEYNRP